MPERFEMISIVAVEPILRPDPEVPLPILEQARYGSEGEALPRGKLFEGKSRWGLCVEHMPMSYAEEQEHPKTTGSKAMLTENRYYERKRLHEAPAANNARCMAKAASIPCIVPPRQENSAHVAQTSYTTIEH